MNIFMAIVCLVLAITVVAKIVIRLLNDQAGNVRPRCERCGGLLPRGMSECVRVLRRHLVIALTILALGVLIGLHHALRGGK